MLLIGMICSWALALYWWAGYHTVAYKLRRANRIIARLRGDTFKG